MAAPGRALKDLWAGRLPLADAFWTYAVFWGVLVNIGATAAALALLVAAKAAAGATAAHAAALAAAALHALPIPFNVVVLVGVWRSAARPDHPRLAGLAARALAGLLFAIFLLV